MKTNTINLAAIGDLRSHTINFEACSLGLALVKAEMDASDAFFKELESMAYKTIDSATPPPLKDMEVLVEQIKAAHNISYKYLSTGSTFFAIICFDGEPRYASLGQAGEIQVDEIDKEKLEIFVGTFE